MHAAQCDGLGSRCLSPLFNVLMTATSIDKPETVPGASIGYQMGKGRVREIFTLHLIPFWTLQIIVYQVKEMEDST